MAESFGLLNLACGMSAPPCCAVTQINIFWSCWKEAPLHNPSKTERMLLTFQHASSGQNLELGHPDMQVGSKEPSLALDR